MANLRLKKEIIGAVDNQIKTNNPKCTKRTYEILLDMGFDKTTAKEKIAAVLLDEIYETLKNEKVYDEAIYEEKLNELVDTCSREYKEEYDENDEGQWTGLEELIWDGYEATEKLQYDKMLENWIPAWEQVKTIVAGAEGKPSIRNLEEATDYAYEIYNWLQDMEMELGNAKEYDKRINFCREVLELFSWEFDRPDNYKAAIGETMNRRGHEECDTWYENWLKEEPGNPACINSYIWCLIDRNEIDRAKELMEGYFNDNTECNIENEIMFIRAASMYKALGNEESARIYEKKLKTFHENFLVNPLQYKDEYDDLSFFDYQPVIKDKKIYPNESCPCGSGKKYKKCCGKT